jgi:Domain of unknown function (DUF4124)
MSLFVPRVLRLAIWCLVCGLALPAQAQWKWRDKDGRVTASDLPPPRAVPDKDILQRPAEVRRAPTRAEPAASAASGPGLAAPPKGPLEREVEARRLAAEQQQAAKARADEERLRAQRAENCRRARSHLAALDSGQRIARVNDKGEREVIDDRVRADEQRQAREVIASDCR